MGDTECLRDLPRWFLMCGRIGGHPVEARWDGVTLEADPAVLDRVALLVALGETLDLPDGFDPVPAGLGTTESAVLTLILAFDRIDHFAYADV